ncbi:MAG: CCA tRNA nucleotidyltransferase [Anaerolineales bacterium]
MNLRIAEHPFVALVRDLVPETIQVYLIGGALRDDLLQRQVADFDFTLSESALSYARKTANRLGGAFFPLDEERQTGRVIWTDEHGMRYKMDFSLLRGNSLEEDLRGRDFTINAMAIDVHQAQRIEDPLGGAQDLLNRTLRVCSDFSLEEDPLRVLRGIRLAVLLELHITPATWQLMKKAAGKLGKISAERIREELFHMLIQDHTSSAIELLERVGALERTFPELKELMGIQQSAPHYLDVYQHTLSVLQQLEQLHLVLTKLPHTQWQANLISGMTSQKLGRYREDIREYLKEEMVPERPRWGLLKLAALYHDYGKAKTQQRDEKGRIHFYGHEEVSALQVRERMRALAFANNELDWVAQVVMHHMRPINLALTNDLPSAKAVYRYYRDVGDAGIAIGLHSLADVLGAYGTAVTAEVWQRHLDVVRTIFEAWWEKKSDVVKPPLLINGYDLMEILGLSPGPQVGRILEAIREAQVSGEVNDRDQALGLARQLLDQGYSTSKTGA